MRPLPYEGRVASCKKTGGGDPVDRELPEDLTVLAVPDILSCIEEYK